MSILHSPLSAPLLAPLLAVVLALLTPCSAISQEQTPAKPESGVQAARAASIEIVGYQPKNDLFLERGHKFTVLVKGLAKGVTAERLRAIYRPTSAVEHSEDVGALEDGKIVWTPSRAGLAKLEAVVVKKDAEGRDEVTVLAERVVSIRPGPGFPIGLLLMCMAGAILFLGAFVSIRALLRG